MKIIMWFVVALLIVTRSMDAMAQEPDGSNIETKMARLKTAAKVNLSGADQLAPELDKQAGQIRGVMEKYKAKSAEVLPELQADLDSISDSLTAMATNITDDTVKATWAGLQNDIVNSVQSEALDEIAANVFAEIKLSEAQIKSVQPIVKEHWRAFMEIVKKGQQAGLDAVPALTAAITKEFASYDAQLKNILNSDQLMEISRMRTDLKNKLFGRIEQNQVAETLARLSLNPEELAKVKDILQQDIKAKLTLLDEASEKGKDVVEQVKSGMDVINGNTRSKFNKALPDVDPNKLDDVQSEGRAKLLRNVALHSM